MVSTSNKKDLINADFIFRNYTQEMIKNMEFFNTDLLKYFIVLESEMRHAHEFIEKKINKEEKIKEVMTFGDFIQYFEKNSRFKTMNDIIRKNNFRIIRNGINHISNHDRIDIKYEEAFKIRNEIFIAINKLTATLNKLKRENNLDLKDEVINCTITETGDKDNKGYYTYILDFSIFAKSKIKFNKGKYTFKGRYEYSNEPIFIIKNKL